jgi:Ca2+-binding EF-hand superfamily protein
LEHDGIISSATLTKFLKSYLRVLVALSNATDAGDDDIHHVCQQLATSICGDGDEANFSDFSAWYNNGGHTHAAWVELIDLAKWVSLEAEDEREEAETRGVPAVDTRINLRLMAETGLGDDQISISKLTSAYVYKFATVLGLSDIASQDMYDLFVNESSDGLISRDGFDVGVRKLTAMTHQQLTGAEKDEYTTLLHSLFYAFDRTGSSELVDVTDLCCGFSIMCKGSKSEKLAFAFDILDDDEDGYLTKRGLWRFFRAFLGALLTLCGALGDHQANVANHILDASSRRTCTSIYDTLNNRDRVTFNDVADWYKVKCDDFPWLELLDLSKWSQLSIS